MDNQQNYPFQPYIEGMKNFHAKIKNGSMQETDVKTFRAKYPHIRAAFYENQSALALALKTNIQIYEMLLQYRFGYYEDEDPITILNEYFISQNLNMSRDELKNFANNYREKHKEHFKDASVPYLIRLFKATQVSYDNVNKGKYREMIGTGYETLIKIPEIAQMLELVSYEDQLKIVFDFHKASVEHIDPTKNHVTRGTNYPSERNVYVGASNLFESTKCWEVHGTLSHEICHLVMFLLYNNRAKPYRDIDSLKALKKNFTGTAKDFQTLTELIKHEENKFQAFKNVFDSTINNERCGDYSTITDVALYHDEVKHAEMIVRVVQLLALYQRDKQKTEECQTLFKPLFDFYRNYIVPDINERIKLMECRKRTREVNEKCGVEVKIAKDIISSYPESFDDFCIDMKSMAASLKPLLNFGSKSIATVSSDKEKIREALKINETFLNISTNCVRLTMKLIHDKVKNEMFEKSCIFTSLENLKDIETLHLLKETFPLSSEPTFIIDCEGENPEDVLNFAFNQNMNERIVLVTNENLGSNFNYHIDHSWKTLTNETKNKLMDEEILFQGEFVTLGFLFESIDSIALDSIPIDDLLKSKITVGKKIEFPDKKFHIERNLRRGSLEYSSDELFEFKSVLLSDEPGNGKSTELKSLAETAKLMNQECFIIFWDLKEFSEEYQKYETFESNEEILEFLCTSILKVQRFERKVISELFDKGRVMLFMDGFDEISPTFTNFLTNLISALVKAPIKFLIVSTRPHLALHLETIIPEKAFQFEPFTKGRQKEFFEKYLNAEKDPEAPDKINGILKLIGTLKLATNPLMMGMIAELFTGPLNELCFDWKEFNFYKVYEMFATKLIRRFLGKGVEATNDTVMYLREQEAAVNQFFTRQAFLNIFGAECSLIKYVTPKTSLSLEQATRIGFMKKSGVGQLEFIHLTFAEFFVADYIAKFLFTQELGCFDEFIIDKVLEMFIEIVTFWHTNDFIRKLLEPAAESFSYIKNSEKSQLVKSKYAEIIKNPKYSYFLTKPKIFVTIKNFIEYNLLNIFNYLLYEVNQADDEETLQIWQGKNRKSMLMIAAQHLKATSVDKIILLAAEKIKDLKDLLFQTNDIGQNILHQAARKKNFEVFNYLVNKICELYGKPECMELLRSVDKTGQNCYYESKLVEQWENISNITINIFGRDFLVEILKTTDMNGNSLLHEACKSSWESLPNFLRTIKENLKGSEINDIFLRPNKDRETALMLAALASASTIFIPAVATLFNFITTEKTLTDSTKNQLLRQQDKKHQTALHCAATNKILVEMFISFYVDMIGIKKTKEIAKIVNKSDKNILILNKTPGTVDVVWDFLRRLFDDVEELKEVLLTHYKSVKNENTSFIMSINFHDFFRINFTPDEKLEFLKPQNVSKFLKSCSPEFINSLFETLEDDENVVKQFMLKNLRTNETIFDLFIIEVHKIILEKAKIYLSPEEVNQLNLDEALLTIDYDEIFGVSPTPSESYKI